MSDGAFEGGCLCRAIRFSVSGKVENFWVSLTVKVFSSTTFSPERVSAVCLLPSSGWVWS